MLIFRKLFNLKTRSIKTVKFFRRKRRKNSVQSKKEYLKYKNQARIIAHAKLEFWQKYYKDNYNLVLNYNRVAIKNTKTRWGSCSSKKNLNFSYKIVHLSEDEQNYLIVHELCHLLEMNHGVNFWKIVCLAIINYQTLRNKLRMWNMQKTIY